MKDLWKNEDSSETYYGTKNNSSKVKLQLAIQTTQTCGA
jgi:hypothetical protein